MTNQEKIKEILTRGVTNVVEKKHLEGVLNSRAKIRVKLGIDPTGAKIHIGRAITLWKLRELQNLGHTIVLIIGDYTGQIGDASDKTAERQILTVAQLKENMKTYKQQIGKILDLKKVEWHNNSDWWGKLTAQEVVAEAMHFTVAQMIERDNFWDRWEAKKPIGLHEILYPIFQGYDSVAIKSDLEIGGNDQYFNLLAGRTIQKKHGQRPQDVMTFEMLEGTDGRKMSTSWGNCIYIEDEPNEMFGKIMSIKDELIVRYFTLCTAVDLKEVKKIETSIKKGANPRDAKVRLAKEIVAQYHSAKKAEEAADNFERQFVKKEVPMEIPVVKLRHATMYLRDILVDVKLAPSKTEARRLIEQGGVKIDGATIGDRESVIEPHPGMIIQVGKRKFVKVK
jgi:tyrosyl-tRNA synthetase